MSEAKVIHISSHEGKLSRPLPLQHSIHERHLNESRTCLTTIPRSQILEPQSATLTNPELLQFLQTHPFRAPESSHAPPTDTSPHLAHLTQNLRYQHLHAPDLKGLGTVLNEVRFYAENVTPHLKESYPEGEELDKAIQEIVKKTKKYGLLKGEVLMLVNLGVGVAGAEAGEGEGEEEEEEVDMGQLAIFDAVVEDREERLSQEQAVEVLGILKECLGRKEKDVEMQG